MPKKKIKELRDLPTAELEDKVISMKAELSKEKAQIGSGSRAENPGKIKKIRRDIARALTLINEKKHSGEKKESKTEGKEKNEKKEEKKKVSVKKVKKKTRKAKKKTKKIKNKAGKKTDKKKEKKLLRKVSAKRKRKKGGNEKK